MKRLETGEVALGLESLVARGEDPGLGLSTHGGGSRSTSELHGC